jgi:hypothetical protein
VQEENWQKQLAKQKGGLAAAQKEHCWLLEKIASACMGRHAQSSAAMHAAWLGALISLHSKL